MNTNCIRALLASLGFVSAVYLQANATPAYSQNVFSHNHNDFQSAKIIDIVADVDGHSLKLLIKLNAQPDIAASQLQSGGFTVSVNGLALSNAIIDPPPYKYVSAATISQDSSTRTSLLKFQTAPISDIKTEIFQNAILITTRLISPAPKKHKIVQSPPNNQTASTDDHASKKLPSLSLLQPTNETCDAALTKIDVNPWDIEALADQTLCLIKHGNTAESLKLAKQVESFAPDNWKAAFAQAEIYRQNGETSQAAIYFSYAQQYADDEQTKLSIQHWKNTPK